MGEGNRRGCKDRTSHRRRRLISALLAFRLEICCRWAWPEKDPIKDIAKIFVVVAERRMTAKRKLVATAPNQPLCLSPGRTKERISQFPFFLFPKCPEDHHSSCCPHFHLQETDFHTFCFLLPLLSFFLLPSCTYPVVASSWKKRRDPPRGAMGGRRGGWWGLYASGGYTPSFSFSHSGHISQDPPPLATIARCKEGGGPSSWQACGSSLGYGEGEGETLPRPISVPKSKNLAVLFAPGATGRRRNFFCHIYRSVWPGTYLPHEILWAQGGSRRFTTHKIFLSVN